MILELFDKISRTDLEYKPTLIILVIIIGVYAGISSLEFLQEHEDCESFGYDFLPIGYCGDYGIRLQLLNEYEFSVNQVLDSPRYVLALAIEKTSFILFDDYRVFSYASSIALLFLTFFITRNVTKTNFTGLISVSFVILSPLFFKYDIVLTYPNFWVTFLLASVYLSMKNQVFSGVFAGVAILTKAISFLYLPALMLFTNYSDIPKDKKINALVFYAGLIGIVLFLLFYIDGLIGSIQFKFQPTEFLWWLGMWTTELQNDRATLIGFMFSIIGLTMLKKLPYAKPLLFFLLFVMIHPAIISGFTTFTNEEYRMLPMVVFVGISLSFILVNIDKLFYEFHRFATISQR